MSKLILVTGGARSGKSRYAEQTAKAAETSVLYVATAIATDEEMKDRIKKHQSSRPESWKTHEGYKGFERETFMGYNVVLVDCLTILVTNLLLEEWQEELNPNEIDVIENKVMKEIEGLISALKANECTGILVTNELGMGLVPEYPLGRVFRDIAGRVNQRVANAADEVVFCVSGIPMKIKG